MSSYYRALSFGTVISALIDDGQVAIAKDDDTVTMPPDIAVEIAAETLRLLLDDERLCNHRGEALSHYLGDNDEVELRRILSRIGGPDRPTFTNC